jgi:hypothetical protein
MAKVKPGILEGSYLSLRFCVGIIGVALPVALLIGGLIFPPLRYSVSGYYYSAMRNILVASLCILGIFLLTYRGYDNSKLDSRITNIAGLATIGVALFPTSDPSFTPAWPGHVHPVAAAVALACQALMALQFTRTEADDPATGWRADIKLTLRALIFRYTEPEYREQDRAERDKKMARNRAYSACAWVIIVGVVLTFAQNFWPDSVKAWTQWMFWFESLSIIAFGIAWLVKGEALRKVFARPGAMPAGGVPAGAIPAQAGALEGAAGDAAPGAPVPAP